MLLLLLRLLLLWVVPGYTRSFSFENNNNNNNNNARGSVARMRSTFLKRNTRINHWNSSGSRSSSNGSGLYSTPISLAEQIVKYLAEEQSNNHCSGDDDATSLPSKLFGFFSASSSLEDDNGNINNKKNNNINDVVTYSSDTIGGGSTGNDYPVLVLSLEDYSSMISDRHSDCQVLFDRYETKTLRCERIIPETTTTTQQQQQQQLVYNIRWEASWIPMGSVWLYNLSDKCEWKINRRVPDPSQIATFAGWTRVFTMFQKAFQTGIIDLPISVVQGTTLLKLQGLSTDDDYNDMENTSNSNHTNGNKNDETTRSSALATKISCKRIVVKESIDLIHEADLGRLQNRRVAQELASWLDVSRRPPKNTAAAEDEEERWASIVRERVLSGVPGTGPLDVDPNENDDEGLVAFVVFGAICLVAFTSSYAILILDVFGRNSSFSELCSSSDGGMVTKSVDVGSGYFSDCY